MEEKEKARVKADLKKENQFAEKYLLLKLGAVELIMIQFEKN